MRLDKYLVEMDYFQSRNRALEAIKSGIVKVDGKKPKPSTSITNDSVVEVEKFKFYVSRAAKKLEGFLDGYNLSLQDKIALDIGSSTGGFAQILLENGIKEIDCVDVGDNQLHISLRNDSRVNLYENTDIREFDSSKDYDVISCDVSFISILQIIDAIENLARSGCDILILYKPQFEVGKEIKRDSKGVVQDIDAITKAKQRFEAKAKELGWEQRANTLSSLKGKEGNQEYMYHFQKL